MRKFLNQLDSKNKNAISFVLKLIGLYLLFQGLYDYVISPYTGLDSILINSIISAAEFGLETLGFNLLPKNSFYEYHMGIEGTSGVVIGNPCDGLSLFILYASFLIVFNGKLAYKMVFILLGIILIHLLNVIRVISLAMIVKYYPSSLDFHHSYTFTLFVYFFIFLLWMFRIKLYQKHKI